MAPSPLLSAPTTTVSAKPCGRLRLVDAVLAIARRRWPWQATKQVVAEIRARSGASQRTVEYWLAGGGMSGEAIDACLVSDIGPDVFDAWVDSQPPEVRARWEKHLEKRALRAELLRREAEIAAARRQDGL